ncbi:MAG: DUF2141 domain-containing protein [Bacteroidota bacterium]|jgi:uncharacterized protein (DUF2141 family)|nr:DUF2141 domain-containing protein [Bacteroidales bacterium]MDI9534996.1 DUF2141 domain-containing protein [Bacteroidota bacterium]NLP20163.1 DUF2141 domain-containing protein [Bacteroidales bacterium]OQC46285.1 MAG: hypothetical protein BWX59_00538 [Bacteroidetes bacterium ADurb.Bin028]HOD87971.1 DUF2141 domain-containing protein [Bacteroidales bacterium]
MKKISFILVFLLSFGIIAHSQSITFNITGIQKAIGRIHLGFFTNEKDYKIEKPTINKYISKKDLKNGKITVRFDDIPAGTYGVCLLDDENENGKMDYSFFIPQEGFGFSNYYHKGMSKPKFDSFKFDLDSGVHKVVEIKIRYM